MIFLKPKDPSAQDFKELNQIERVRVRIGEPKAGFSCSVSVYGCDGKYSAAQAFKVKDMSFLGNLYAKVTHHINRALEADEVRRSIGENDVMVVMDDTPIDELVEAYRAAMLTDFGENTTGTPTARALKRSRLADKWRDLGDFIESMNDQAEAEAGILAWLEHWQMQPKENGQPKKGSTLNRALSETRTFMKWLKRSGLIPFHIKLEDVEWRKSKVEFAPSYMIDEIRAMLAVDDRHVFRIAVHAYTGLRLQEVLNLRWSDIRRKQIWIRKSKTDTPRFVQIMPELMALFKQRKNDGHSYEGLDKQTGAFIGEDFLFTQLDRTKNYCSQRRDIERIQKKAGVSPIAAEELATYEAQVARAEDPSTVVKPRHRRFHAFRWTYASCMLRSGCDSSRLILQMGHEQPQMMRHYAQISALMDEVDDENWPDGVLQFADVQELVTHKESIIALRLVGT